MFSTLINFLFGDRTFGAIRSPEWSKVRKEYLRNEPLCAVCKTKGSLLNHLEVHHCLPFHLHPNLELDPDNLITLCRTHHLLFGHLMNFKSFNENVRADALTFWQKIKSRPR